VVFDTVFDNIPATLSLAEFKAYSSRNKQIGKSYILKGNKYLLRHDLSDRTNRELLAFFFEYNSLYIIDNGHGMNKETILNHWMVIGTGNKEANHTSDDGRVRTGAKGIGRFALDRLGVFTEMWTVSKDKKANGLYWSMDWRQFDLPEQSISEVEALLEEKPIDLGAFLQECFSETPRILDLISQKSFSTGTVLKISGLKDSWAEPNLALVYKSLEALIPPKELAIPFSVSFFHLQKPKQFGEVETAFFNDYDYRVYAKFNSNDLSIDLTITRDELDLKKVKKEFIHIFKNAKRPFDIKTLEKKEFKIKKSATDLLRWEDDEYSKNVLTRLGSLSFLFYFIKTIGSQKEAYPYKAINSTERRAVFERFGGIKIYRDSFRVRPYGEIGNDWLKLGERAGISPAGAGQRIGDWRVKTHQIAGIVNISRITNPHLIDKSDRGALQENETFETLKQLLIAVIYEFELDRSKILNPFYEASQVQKELNRKAEIRAEAIKLADRIIDQRSRVEEKVYGTKADLFKSVKIAEEKAVYQKEIERSFEKFDKSDDDDAEVAQVRTLASLGLIVSSFAHELKEARNNFDDIQELEDIFHKIVPDEKKKAVDYKDGVNIIELLKRENQKISHWVDYALTAIKRDKRKRGAVNFDKYFTGLNKSWEIALSNRNIKLEIRNTIKSPPNFKAFEMDLNTIFNNLISNSIEAFNNLREIRDRKIRIAISSFKANIQIVYADNGTGLPKVFKKNPEEIFLPFTTSKRDREDNDIGTGLGMYLVKSVVSDNNGLVSIQDSDIGFKLRIEFPTQKKRNK